VRAAFASWPKGTLSELQGLVRQYPRDPVVQFNYGTVLLCRGYLADAEDAYRQAKTVGRNTIYEIDADNVLHPQFFQGGYPIFQPTHPEALLEQGVLLQREGHQHSAERVYARAARLQPKDAEAQVAAAVARFDEDNLSAAFSRLGPLTRRFPKSQSVRYHLGLLLAWTGQRTQAVREFRLARELGPKTELGQAADLFLRRLITNGTSSTRK
jgi:Flp pilus assembly protein TadD